MELIGEKDLPQNLDGKSILSTVNNPSQAFERGPIYFHFPHFSGQGGYPAGAVRDGEWKLVEDYETGKTELFNLAEDIAESNDLKFSEPEKTEKLWQMLKNWQKSIGAKMPARKAGHKY